MTMSGIPESIGVRISLQHEMEGCRFLRQINRVQLLVDPMNALVHYITESQLHAGNKVPSTLFNRSLGY